MASRVRPIAEKFSGKDRETLAGFGIHLPRRHSKRDLLEIWKDLASEYDTIAESLIPWTEDLRAVVEDTESKELRQVADAAVEIAKSVSWVAGLAEITAKLNRVMMWQAILEKKEGSKDELKAVRREYEDSWKLLKKAANTANERSKRGENIYE